MLTQGKDDNEAGRKKDKQDTVNTITREYICVGGGSYERGGYTRGRQEPENGAG